MSNNPKKNNLWNVMKNISSTYYKLDSFERIHDNKFIENSNELSTIGKEIFDNFSDVKINFFLDICAAPGMYSKELLERTNASGVGISLPPEKGGVKFEIENKKYKMFYKDILEKDHKIETPKPFDFGMASCVSYMDTRNAHNLNMELILTSMKLILDSLEEGGNMMINMTMKNIYSCYNIIHHVLMDFDSIKLWKSHIVWGTKNTFYLFCYGYKNSGLKDKLKNMINEIKNERSNFNNMFLGDNKSYNTITKMMNDIYIVRINCWLKLLGK